MRRPTLWLRLTAALVVVWGGASAMIACTRAASVHTVAVAPARGPRIDHAGHMDRGLECANCHVENAMPGDPKEPRMPTYKACAECHDDEDAKKPEAEKVKNVFFRPDGTPAWQSALVRYDPEIRFRHAAHQKTACAVCHGEMKGKDRIEGLMFSMENCMACHAAKGVRSTCQSCHAQIDVDKKPATHERLWRQRHGQLARSKAQYAEGRCGLCHDKPTFCEVCHREEKPASHTNLWRLRTHGVMVAIDRSTCMVCHTTDYCVRCHDETAPMSHRAGWATGPTIHCITCHFPITRRDQNCVVCHKENPTHDTATDLPPSHNPAMNCRLCHNTTGAGGAPRIPHPDNGTQCTVCHH